MEALPRRPMSRQRARSARGFTLLELLIALGVTALVVGVVSVVCLARQAEPLDRWVGAFVAGGGGGNLVDRVQIGAVVDFLDFHWRSIHWPAFNLADVFVVSGAALLILASVAEPRVNRALQRRMGDRDRGTTL